MMIRLRFHPGLFLLAKTCFTLKSLSLNFGGWEQVEDTVHVLNSEHRSIQSVDFKKVLVNICTTMDIKKLCRFNFKRQETTAGHCERSDCKFLHPDPPLDEDDPLWCPDDLLEDGGCLNPYCPLFHPNSCFKSQINKLKKLRNEHGEQSRRIYTRSESPADDTRHGQQTSQKTRRLEKRSHDRSESPVAKRKKLSTKMEMGCQYKIIKEFSKDDVSSRFRHHDKMSVDTSELVTFVSMCSPRQSCDNYCSFARVRNQFGEEGYIPVKCLEDDQSVPLTCPLSPACEGLLFSDQETLHSHLCLHHFHQELKMHLKSSDKCPICDERMESDDLILHFGSSPHHKVVPLISTKGIRKALESFKEQSDMLLKETVMKINLGHQQSIKEIQHTEENKVSALNEKIRLSEREKEQLIEDKRGIETERDDLDSEKIDCINDIKLVLGERMASQVNDLKSIADIVRTFSKNNLDQSSSTGKQTNYPQAESSLKTYHKEKGNNTGKCSLSMECSVKERQGSINDKRVVDLNCELKELKNSLSKTKADLSDMEQERDDMDEKLEASEQMRKEDAVRFSKQLEALRQELSAQDKLFAELHLKLEKKNNIIKNIIPLIESHLETS